MAPLLENRVRTHYWCKNSLDRSAFPAATLHRQQCAGRLGMGGIGGPTGAGRGRDRRPAAGPTLVCGLRSDEGLIYERVLMERNYCRGVTSPPASMLCLVASPTVVDLINVAIHEAPCVCGAVERHRQHFVGQLISVAADNSLDDVDHTQPHRVGVASGV